MAYNIKYIYDSLMVFNKKYFNQIYTYSEFIDLTIIKKFISMVEKWDGAINTKPLIGFVPPDNTTIDNIVIKTLYEWNIFKYHTNDKSLIKVIRYEIRSLNKRIVNHNRIYNKHYKNMDYYKLNNHGLIYAFINNYYKRSIDGKISFKKIRKNGGYTLDNLYAGTNSELTHYLISLGSKTCTLCNNTKSFVMFNRDSTKFDGLETRCSACSKKVKQLYHRTLNGKIKNLYKDEVNNSKKRNRVRPSYTKKWFIKWCMRSELFITLYEKWVESGYDKDLAPSVDRIDSNKPYTKNNIQVMTWYDNNKKGRIENSKAYRRTNV